MRTFSSGTEYECFLATFCEECRQHIADDTDDLNNPEQPCYCPIEFRMESARFTNEDFPDNFIKYDNGWTCTAFEKGRHPYYAKEIPPIDDIWKFKEEA